MDSHLLEGIALKEKEIISRELMIQLLTSKNDTVLSSLPPYISNYLSLCDVNCPGIYLFTYQPFVPLII